MVTSRSTARTATSAGRGRYPRGEFDACYWRLADLCELAVDLPLAKEWAILEAFDQIAEIGTPRHLQLAGLDHSEPPTGLPPGLLGAGQPSRAPIAAETPVNCPSTMRDNGESDGSPVTREPEAEAVAAEVLDRVARLAVRASALDHVFAWGRIRDLLTTAFPRLGHPGRASRGCESDALA